MDMMILKKQFLMNERIVDKESLDRWLLKNGKTEQEMNKQLYNANRLEKFKKKSR